MSFARLGSASVQGTTTSGYHNNCLAQGNSQYHHKHQGPKQKQTIRPCIRFVLRRLEHCTKIIKLDHGHPVWTKQHQNSCILPCPPNEVS